MAFDQSTRNFLQRTVTKCREILAGRWQAPTEGEFFRQLQEIYGISPDGVAAPMEVLAHLGDEDRETACVLRDTIDHYTAGLKASGKSEKDARREAVMRVAREQAFTVLNRLAALRMAEERGIVLECVRKGTQSEGFQLFLQSAGSAFGSTSSAYRAYLHLLFDELARDLGVLFNRFDKGSLIFPRHEPLESLLKELNGTGEANHDASFSPEQVASLWGEDETVGWIYQYYNDPSERKKMREESSAPRNSRELAVRNQFFTPRYVVEFLTDNTLGRIWYEMTHGDTTLKEQCRYLVRRPTEIFLQPNETAPQQPKQDNLSQEDLLKQPVFILHRPLKDPRTILMLDPACGSMHFGLYAFDLFEVIYDEAWALEEKLGEDALSRPPGMKSLHDTYAGKDAFVKDVPRLIIENNIHGIDIDPRAAQIAGLSLWLRAQRAWQRLGLKPAERPAIKRSNIVCAEPMPGEKELLREFVEREFPAAERAVCLQLLEAIFDKMQLAGEAGSLLKIEEEISSAIEEAKKQWKAGPKMEQSQLFGSEKLKQQDIPIDHSGLTEGEFWDQLEEKVYTALRDYAEQAEHGGGFQRRLFAEDAARGFAFIDICRKRYDVALMNPPFGAFSQQADEILNRDFSDCRGDLYPCFIQRWGKRSEKLGAITNRTGLTLSGLAPWRVSSLLTSPRLTLLADLGMGVLDALVETALFVLGQGTSDFAVTFDLLATPKDRASGILLDACSNVSAGIPASNCFVRNPDAFRKIPGSPICYRIPPGFLNTFLQHPSMEREEFVFRSTSPNYDDFRFMRLRWEAPSSQFGREKRWSTLAKGGEYRPYYADIELLIDWDDNRQTFRGYTGSVHRPMERPACADIFFSPGITWSGRTASRFSPRVLPVGSIFSSKGPYAGGLSNHLLLTQLGIMMSAPFQAYLELFVQAGDATSSGSAARDYQVGALRGVPDPQLPTNELAIVQRRTLEVAREVMLEAAATETSSLFFRLISSCESSLASALKKSARARVDSIFRILAATQQIDEVVGDSYKFGKEEWAYTHSLFGQHPLQYPERDLPPKVVTRLLQQDTEAVIQEAIAEGNTGRFITIKGYYADRHLEVAAHVLGVSAAVLREGIVERICGGDAIKELAEKCVSLWIGIAFGRWDIRYATGEQAAPELPDPFAPLPVCPPGQLQNTQGLPARPEDVPAAYPVRIPWDGILVDDSNHPLDIERRVREVIEIIWSGQEGGPTAEATEHEACEILGVKSLRDYFRKPAGFFADHLKRYSKSRRQAPIYWPLSTASGSYTLWIYYHRLTPDTLYKCLQQFVEPKIKDVEQGIHRLRTMLTADEAGTKERKQLADAETLLNELKELHAELSLWAPKWKPNLNDGVLITACPLWKLFRLPKWRKDLEACWKELEAGDYDWSHLAYTLFPARVREKCKTDRSIAIAHGLEDLCQVQAPAPKAKRAKKQKKLPTEEDGLL